MKGIAVIIIGFGALLLSNQHLLFAQLGVTFDVLHPLGSGAACHWSMNTITYYIDNGFLPNDPPWPRLTQTQVESAVQAAFTAWQNVTPATISFNYGGTTLSGANAFDGLVTLVWITDEYEWNTFTQGNTGAKGYTDVVSDDLDGTIWDADIGFDAVNYDDMGGVHWSISDLNAHNNIWDIQSIATHEIGHVVGLAHTPLDQNGNPIYNFSCSVIPTMMDGATAFRLCQSQIEAPNFTLRSLAPADEDGINHLYGSGNMHQYVLALAGRGLTYSALVTSGNNQRKLYRESSGTLHEVYESGGDIIYRKSTDAGSSWTIIKRMNSTGFGGCSMPSVTLAGSTILVCWQHAMGASWTWDVQVSRSTDGGSSWSTPATRQTVSWASSSPGPLPSISAGTDGSIWKELLAFASNSGIVCQKSTDGGVNWTSAGTMPATGSSCNRPSSAIYRYSTWHYILQAQIAYASDISSGTPYIYHNCYDYDAGAFGATPTNLCTIIPNYTMLHHANPSLAVGTPDGNQTVHVAWDALDPDNPFTGGRVILYRKKLSAGGFENVYTAIRYQGLVTPSITGLTSDNAYMVYQNASGTQSIWKARYFWTGSYWGWGYPSIVATGTNSQISVGSSSAKYLWTDVSSMPRLGIALSSETLSKAAQEEPWLYLRTLNVIDTLAGSYASIEFDGGRVRSADGTVRSLAFATSPSDSLPVQLGNLQQFGSVVLPSSFSPDDTLEFCYAMRGRDVASVLGEVSAPMGFQITGSAPGNVPLHLVSASVSSVTPTSTLVTLQEPLAACQQLIRNGGTLTLQAVMHAGKNPNLIASIGHVYQCAGLSAASKEQPGVGTPESGPMSYALMPCYPNPFNPSTTLRYSLPQAAHVTLVLYNTLGQKVADVVSGEMAAGYHEARWDAGGVASGVYFARFLATDGRGQILRSQTMKLVLMK